MESLKKSSSSPGELDRDSEVPREYSLATVTWDSALRILRVQVVISDHGNSGLLPVSYLT